MKFFVLCPFTAVLVGSVTAVKALRGRTTVRLSFEKRTQDLWRVPNASEQVRPTTNSSESIGTTAGPNTGGVEEHQDREVLEHQSYPESAEAVLGLPSTAPGDSRGDMRKSEGSDWFRDDPETQVIVMNALLLSYQITKGSYKVETHYERIVERGEQFLLERGFPQPASKQAGWQVDQEDGMLDPVSGVHGIVLTTTVGQRAIIAIRGTDLRPLQDCIPKSQPGCVADMCANKGLFDQVINENLPADCNDLPNRQGYLDASMKFVKGWLCKHEDFDVMLIGHSLGGALALHIGSELLDRKDVATVHCVTDEDPLYSIRVKSLHVVAVSPPPFKELVVNGDLMSDPRFIVLYNDLDPLFYATHLHGGFAGITPLCYEYQESKMSESLNRESNFSRRFQCNLCGIQLRERHEPLGGIAAIWPPGPCDKCVNKFHTIRQFLIAASDGDVLLDCCTDKKRWSFPCEVCQTGSCPNAQQLQQT